MIEIPDELAKQLEINFEEGFWDWQDIQGSTSMDFPVKWDNLMHQIEAWKVGAHPEDKLTPNSAEPQKVKKVKIDAWPTILHHAELKGYKVFTVWLDGKKLTEEEIKNLEVPVTVKIQSEIEPGGHFLLSIASTETYRKKESI